MEIIRSLIFLGLFTFCVWPVWGQQLYVDPNKSFSIMIPPVLLPCELSGGRLACPSENPALSISVKDVPLGSSVELMALNAEDALMNKQNFKIVGKPEILNVDGNKVVVTTMTFNNLGNVTLPVVVRVENAVLGTKAFELQVACNQHSCPQLLGAFDDAMASLHLARKDQALKKDTKKNTGFGLQDWLKDFKF